MMLRLSLALGCVFASNIRDGQHPSLFRLRAFQIFFLPRSTSSAACVGFYHECGLDATKAILTAVSHSLVPIYYDDDTIKK